MTDDEEFVRRIVVTPYLSREELMTGPEFQRLLDAEPFEPFTVTLTGGWMQTIDRPELVIVTPDGGCARIARPDGTWAASISLDHVTAITPIVPTIFR